MFHYVYQITNLIDGKIYIGKHSTEDLEDGYMGSGSLLVRAIKKHGLENFRKVILETFQSSDEAFSRERELVSAAFVLNKQTYNLVEGGNGGSPARMRELVKKQWEDPEFRARHSERAKETVRRLHEQGLLFGGHERNPFKGKHHSLESKRKIGIANSLHQRGKGNSQFGKIWIKNEFEKRSMKVMKDDVERYLNEGWLLGRKTKWTL